MLSRGRVAKRIPLESRAGGCEITADHINEITQRRLLEFAFWCSAKTCSRPPTSVWSTTDSEEMISAAPASSSSPMLQHLLFMVYVDKYRWMLRPAVPRFWAGKDDPTHVTQVHTFVQMPHMR